MRAHKYLDETNPSALRESKIKFHRVTKYTSTVDRLKIRNVRNFDPILRAEMRRKMDAKYSFLLAMFFRAALQTRPGCLYFYGSDIYVYIVIPNHRHLCVSTNIPFYK